MDKKFKWILAIEALIIIVFVTLLSTKNFSSNFNWNIAWFSFMGYFLYLLIRFIIWAIKILRRNRIRLELENAKLKGTDGKEMIDLESKLVEAEKNLKDFFEYKNWFN